MIAQAVGIGIIASFLFTEWVGLSAGGLIVPGYLAFFLDQPIRVGVTFLVACLSYGLVRLLSRYVILYGQRRFMATVLIAYLLGWALEMTVIQLPTLGQDFRMIGYIIPGLIANDMIRQGVGKTILSALTVTVIVRLAITLLLIS